MPQTLREPFFLRGRRSVLQRAVILSLVLGTLSAAAGWIAVGIPLLLREVAGADPVLVGIPVAWGVATSALVFGPLNFWNARSWFWTLAAAPSGFAIMFLFMLWSADRPSDLSIEARAMLGFPVVLLTSGLLLIRRGRRHRWAYLVSVASSGLPVVVMPLHSFLDQIDIAGFRLPIESDLVFLAALFGSLSAALSIPWGIPFWWPQEDHRRQAQPA
jgi:hypothetical protein